MQEENYKNRKTNILMKEIEQLGQKIRSYEEEINTLQQEQAILDLKKKEITEYRNRMSREFGFESQDENLIMRHESITNSYDVARHRLANLHMKHQEMRELSSALELELERNMNLLKQDNPLDL